MSGSSTGILFTEGPYVGATALADNTAAAPGRGIMFSVSADAHVVVTLQNGGTVDVYPQAGASGTNDNIYPFSATKYVKQSGTIVSAFNLF